jgi:phosphoribosyl-ATP pyrophosphohydrolase
MTDILKQLDCVLQERQSYDPAKSYVASLYQKGEDAILQKIGEEATETILAAKSCDNEHLKNEIADMWFHSLVLLVFKGLSSEDVLAVLKKRFGLSGIEEKKQRKQ